VHRPLLAQRRRGARTTVATDAIRSSAAPPPTPPGRPAGRRPHGQVPVPAVSLSRSDCPGGAERLALQNFIM
jgi:hypothetical protein